MISEERTLTVYSKIDCPNCTLAKNLLNKYDVPYREVRIDEDAGARKFILSQGFRSVPQIFLGDTLFVQGGWRGLMKMSEEDIRYRLEYNAPKH